MSNLPSKRTGERFYDVRKMAVAFSWSTQALVLPRLAKSERSGYWATALSYGVVAPFFAATGGVMAQPCLSKTGVYEIQQPCYQL